MALVVKDRVKQTTTTTGTGSIVLNGSVGGYQTFSDALATGDTTYYALTQASTGDWEVGLGTWTESTTTLARTTILASSNSNAAINLTAQAEVFITQPASKAVFFNADGDVDLTRDPQTALQAATKQYVDTIAAAGLHYHDPVRVEQEGNLSATYDNGTAGVGATLTNNSTQAALSIDGVTLSLNDRVLIYEQTDATQNGVYTVTNTGSASTNWVLTRSTDTDSYAPSDPDSLGQGDAFFVLEGDAGAGELYVMNTEGSITFGTTDITFTQVASTAVYSAGTGITLTGTEFAIGQDVGTADSPSFSGLTINGNATFDTNTLFVNSATNRVGIGNTSPSTTLDVSGTINTSGNITVSGTVDGRDVAADGTKLDGIESGATGDQTASEILTAIKTVDGSGSGLDADTLDGQQGSYYQAASSALTTSTTFGGDVSGTYNNIVVANDSHTHDGRYYTETEADSRFVNASSDTMTGPLTIDHNTSGMLRLSATNSGPWAIDLQRDDATNSRVYNGGGYWAFEHEPRYHNGGSHQKIFHDGYHPNADKWTTARTLSLSGDASGSVSWDGSANATLSVTVANDSHTHDGRYYTESEADSRFLRGDTSDTMSGNLTVTGNIKARNGDDSDVIIGEHPSYTAYGAVWLDGESDYRVLFDPSGGHTFLNALGTGHIYFRNDNSTLAELRDTGDMLVGGNTVWHAGNDGSGSGLDADTVDGIQASSFLRSDASDTFTTLSGTTMTATTLRAGDGTDGRFFSDSAGRTAFADGDFYIQPTVSNYYNYATNQYHGNTSGDNHYFRGNTLSGNSWSLTGAGAFTAASLDISGSVAIGSEVVLQESTDRADLLQITSTTSGWGGLQIRNSSNEGRWSFMTDANNAGLYDDENGDWHVYMSENAGVQLRYNGTTKLQTESGGVTITGTCTATSFSGDGSGLTGLSSLPDDSFTIDTGSDSFIAFNTAVDLFNTYYSKFKFNGYLDAEKAYWGYGAANGNAELVCLDNYLVLSHQGISNSGIKIEANNSGCDLRVDVADDIVMDFGSNNITFDAGASEVRLNCRMEATEFEATSDINLKENIELLTDPLGKLSGISGYSYNFKDTGKASYGVIAQEVEEVLPDAVATNAEGTKSVNYNSIVALLVETIKEQEKRIAALEEKVGV